MSVNLATISDAIKSRNFRQAEYEIIHVVRYIALNGFAFTTPQSTDVFSQQNNVTEQDILIFCNQFVAVFSELLGQKSYTASDEMIFQMVSCKFALEWIFLGSAWKTSDPLIEHLNLYRVNSRGELRISGRNLGLLYILIFASTKFELDWRQLFKANPEATLQLLVSIIGQQYNVLSKQSCVVLNKIFNQLEDFPMVKFSNLDFINVLSISYFSCSYLDDDDKYKYKKWLVKLMKYNIEQSIDVSLYEKKQTRVASESNNKTKILVMLEAYSKSHAMYRCYHACFEEMAKSFELIGCGEYDEKDADVLYSPFSSFINIEDKTDIERNLKTVSQVDADIIYYPSVGMSLWGIYLSLFRLAPIQVMSAGHPSSTFSENMDKLLIPNKETMFSGIENYISEQPVFLPEEQQLLPSFYTFPKDLAQTELEQLNDYVPVENNIVRIAINGVVQKVSHTLISACNEIQAKSSKKIEFIFFSNERATSMAGLASKSLIEKELKGVTFYYNQNYKDYLKAVSHCHFCLPTYPFGGSNSNIDAMLLNKPKLFVKGKKEFYTRTDHYDWDSIELSDDLGCEDLTELVAKAVHLSENEDEIKRIRQKIIDADVLNTRFVSERNNNNALVYLFERVLEEHRKESE